MQPEWRRDGRELFFASADGKLMAVDVQTGGVTFTGGVPRALFEIEIPEPTQPHPTDYAASADGERFFYQHDRCATDAPVPDGHLELGRRVEERMNRWGASADSQRPIGLRISRALAPRVLVEEADGPSRQAYGMIEACQAAESHRAASPSWRD
jgi:hypothetical protein